LDRGRSTGAAQATGVGGERVEVEVTEAMLSLYKRPSVADGNPVCLGDE
jgi:hypothetical protein